MAKSQSAFRTISEVAATLDTPTHVLRFWESKFTQIKPVKRAGGRRYYRPEDIDLLAGIKTLLHEQGMTIKGAQKLLREQGVNHVIALSEAAKQNDDAAPEPAPAPEVEPTAIAPADDAPAPVAEVIPLAPATPTAAPEIAEKLAIRPPFVATILDANQVAIAQNSQRIAPLIDKLSEIRDRIRASL